MRGFPLNLNAILSRYTDVETPGSYKVAAWIGIVIVPFFYIVVKYVVPIPDDNLNLRLGLMVLSLSLFLEKRFRRFPNLRRFYWIFYVTIHYPFFTTYMMFTTDYHYLWIATVFSGFAIPFLVFPSVLASVLSILSGVGAAAAVYLFQFGHMPMLNPCPVNAPLTDTEIYLGLVAVFLYVFVATTVLNFRRKSIEQQSAMAIKKWAAMILHQAMTPLNEMQLAVEGIGLHLDDRPKLRELTDSVVEKGRLATEMTRRLIAFAMPLDRRARFEQIPARATIQSAIDSYPFGIAGSGEIVDLIRFEEGPDFIISTPCEPFVQAIHNLINNAMHAIRDSSRGRIRIQTVSESRRNVVVFEDTASGIPPEELPDIFEGFYTRRQGGLGQGLTYCHQFMVHVNGKINCESQTGVDAFTRFRLEFPPV